MGVNIPSIGEDLLKKTTQAVDMTLDMQVSLEYYEAFKICWWMKLVHEINFSINNINFEYNCKCYGCPRNMAQSPDFGPFLAIFKLLIFTQAQDTDFFLWKISLIYAFLRVVKYSLMALSAKSVLWSGP